jgi:hypothetical protein
VSQIVVSLGEGLELRLSQHWARRIQAQLSEGLERRTSATELAESRMLILPDDHPLWEQHTGLGGHRDHPEWAIESDLHLAQAFYEPVDGKAKVLLDILIDHPGQQLSVDDICAKANGVFTGSRSIAGAINGLRRSYEVSGRRYPFYWWEGRPARYAMKTSVASLFRQARSDLAG